MATRPIVILHGWSDNSTSFERLGKFLETKLERPTRVVNLADWVSMNDDVRYTDLREGMQRAWEREELPVDHQSVDVVVHSTGALVVRDWMTDQFQPDTVPIHRLLMLAPANYGSPLAHKGRAFYGRIAKGSKTGFQTGTHILKGLELASPYTRDLAMKDVLSRKKWYGKDRILATVLVGNKGYGGVRAAANEDGGDGTVRISTANLNSALIIADFSRHSFEPEIDWESPAADERTGFCILNGDNHGTITMNESGTPKNPQARELMVEALSVTSAGWDPWLKKLDTIVEELDKKATPGSKSAKHGFQNTVFRVRDDMGTLVDDYFLEFYEKDTDRGWLGKFFHRDAIRSVHSYGDQKTCRSVYIDVTLLHSKIDKIDDALEISLRAEPEFIEDESIVGYKTFDKDSDIGSIKLNADKIKQVFQNHRTLFVDVVLKREIAEKIFLLKKLQ